jgi:AcrR family transcriptional regulator
MRLFAERGFRETSVGDIESAVGLQPRRGALYRHFPSKEALLHAAVNGHLERIDRGLTEIDALTGSDPLDSLMTLGRWFLAELDAAEPLFRVLEQDQRLLREVRDSVRDRVVDAGHRRVSDLIRARAGDVAVDADASAALIIGPLVNQRRTAWTFGRPPLAVDDERLLRAWHATVVALVTSIRQPPATI